VTARADAAVASLLLLLLLLAVSDQDAVTKQRRLITVRVASLT